MIYLIVKKTQSGKVHPEDFKGAWLTKVEADEEAHRLNRMDLFGNSWKVEPVDAYGNLVEAIKFWTARGTIKESTAHLGGCV